MGKPDNPGDFTDEQWEHLTDDSLMDEDGIVREEVTMEEIYEEAQREEELFDYDEEGNPLPWKFDKPGSKFRRERKLRTL